MKIVLVDNNENILSNNGLMSKELNSFLEMSLKLPT